MSENDFETSFLVYLKLMDGLVFPLARTKTVCDLSFDGFVTAKYLADKYEFDKIYTLSKDEMLTYKNILPIKVSSNIAKSMSSVKCDLLLSLAGSFDFQPIYETVHAVHKALNVGGKFIFALYPMIFDQSGNDVIRSLSMISNQPVAEKLVRWKSVINNSMRNIFIKISEDELMQAVSYAEIKAIFRSNSFFSHLFETEAEYDLFFKPLDEVINNTYSASWKVISGIRI